MTVTAEWMDVMRVAAKPMTVTEEWMDAVRVNFTSDVCPMRGIIYPRSILRRGIIYPKQRLTRVS